MTGVVCVIPAFNAAPTLRGVIDGLRASLPGAAIVGIDDGSTDATASIMRDSCDLSESFPANRGKGAALQAGFSHATTLGAKRVVTIDADGQHDPSCAPALGPFLLHGLKNHEGKSVETVAGARPASWRRLMF